MAEDQLRTLIDDIRSRLQAELEAHLGTVTETHEREIESARRQVESDTAQRWRSKLDDVRTEWEARLQSEVAATRSDVQGQMVAESTRLRLEAEQAAAEAAARARRELDEAVSTERTRAQADLERAQAKAAEEVRRQLDEAVSSERTRAQTDLERVRAEAVAEARRQLDEAVSAERARADAELERAQTEAAVQARRELDEAVSTERTRAQADLERAQAERERAHADLERAHADLARVQADHQRTHADRARAQADLERAHADLEHTKADLLRVHGDLERTQAQLETAQILAKEIREGADRELAQARAAFDAERAATADAIASTQQAAPSPAREPSELLGAVKAIDESTTLSAALAAVVRGAALESPRVALFIVNGSTLREWPVEGVPSVAAGQIQSDGPDAGFLADVLRSGQAQSIDGMNGHFAPAFAGLAAGRRAIAVPFVLGDRPVAVLYADEGTDGRPLDSWRETVQILGRHASAFIAYLTAVRTAQALRLIGGGNEGNATDDEAQGARRYARLLVSEIKLYNESAVRTGRERRDLQHRLKAEIERARRLYEERITPSPARDLYFQQELVQTLADGDQTLLG